MRFHFGRILQTSLCLSNNTCRFGENGEKISSWFISKLHYSNQTKKRNNYSLIKMVMENIKSEDNIYVLDDEINVRTIIRNMANTSLHKDPFIICNLGEIVRKYTEWKQAMPRISPHYAVKCNDHFRVLEVMVALGLGFDCASKTEIDKILDYGVDPSRIIFASPTKPVPYLQHAAICGVETMTFDNEYELYKVKEHFPTAKLVIRIRCDDPKAHFKLGAKYGCDYKTEAPHLLETAKELDLNVIGVSFHVGSGCSTTGIFRTAISYARYVFDYAERLGFEFDFLDIGGGFSGRHEDPIGDMAATINSAVEEFFPDPRVKIISEPGRYFVEACFTLACNIHSLKRTMVKDPDTEIDAPFNMYYINDGVFGSLNCALWDQPQPEPRPLKKYPGSKLTKSHIWGPTCDSSDLVSKNALLPDEMTVGDWIVYEDMGAYSLTLCTPFNGFPLTKIYSITDKSLWQFLKDKTPYTEDHFVFGKIIQNSSI